ncbi:tetratricopeptide repeat protein, partial [Planctomycetota bacterium]
NSRMQIGRFVMGLCLFGIVLGMSAGCASKSQSNNKYRSKIEEAESDFDSGKNAPPSAKTLYSMGNVLAAQGKDRESEFIYKRCIQEYPYYLPAYNSLAELYTRQGRTNEAIEFLGKALEIHERDPVVLNNLGICYIIRREYDKAFKYFLGAASVIPSKERYRANMATALGMLGREEESLALLEQVLPPEDAKHNAEVLRRARLKSEDLKSAQS